MSSSSASAKRSRAFCFTWFLTAAGFTAQDYKDKVAAKLEPCDFVVFQLEACPTTGNQHVQGYCHFANARTLSSVRKRLKDASVVIADGSAQQNLVYCTKAETRVPGTLPYTRGEVPSPGARNDIADVVKKISGAKRVNWELLIDEHPTEIVRYHKGFQFVAAKTRKPRSWQTTVSVIWGPPGSGKTWNLARLLEGKDPFYLTKSMCSGATTWWDRYEGQEDVVLEEFSGWLPISTLIDLINSTPVSVQVKGGTTQFVAKRIWITSNFDPTTWYGRSGNVPVQQLQALHRRLSPPIAEIVFWGYGPDHSLKNCPCDVQGCPNVHVLDVDAVQDFSSAFATGFSRNS